MQHVGYNARNTRRWAGLAIRVDRPRSKLPGAWRTNPPRTTTTWMSAVPANSASTRAGISTGNPKSTAGPVTGVAGDGGVDDDDHLRTTRPLHLTLDECRQREGAEVVLLLERIRRTLAGVDSRTGCPTRRGGVVAASRTSPDRTRQPDVPCRSCRSTTATASHAAAARTVTSHRHPGCDAPTPAHADGTRTVSSSSPPPSTHHMCANNFWRIPGSSSRNASPTMSTWAPVTSPLANCSPRPGAASVVSARSTRPHPVTQIATASHRRDLSPGTTTTPSRSSPRAPPAPHRSKSTDATSAANRSTIDRSAQSSRTSKIRSTNR